MKYRWSKGNKNSPSVLPNGDKIIFLTVGGRTSAVVPSVQKVTGQIAEIAEAAEISQSEEDAVNNDKVGEVVSPKKPKGKRTKQESKSERKGSWPLRAKTIPKEAPTAEKSTKLILSASEDEEDEDEREEDYSPGRKRSRV